MAGDSINCSVTGTIVLTSGGFVSNTSVLITKYAGANGALIWRAPHSAPGQFGGVPIGLKVDANGDVFTAGSIETFSGNAIDVDALVVKHAGATGVRLWTQRFDSGSSYDGASSHRPTRSRWKMMGTPS